jgi:hypothetical protein
MVIILKRQVELWKKIWSWPVVGGILFLLLSTGVTFTTFQTNSLSPRKRKETLPSKGTETFQKTMSQEIAMRPERTIRIPLLPPFKSTAHQTELQSVEGLS